MGVFGTRIFVFDELFAADQSLRGQARAVLTAAGELTLPSAGLPPEARSAVAGLAGLRGRLERAADALTEAAIALGQTGAAAQRADSAGWLDSFGTSMRDNLLPPGGYGPLGIAPWLFGRLGFLVDGGSTLLRHRYGYPWVKDGNHWRVNGSGPRLHPLLRPWADRAAKAGRLAGPAAVAGMSLNERLKNGASVPKAAAGAVGETATVFGCATAGAKAGAAVPIPHPIAKGALVVGGGVVGGAACSGPGKWVGDKVSDGASHVADKVGDGAKKVVGVVGKIVP